MGLGLQNSQNPHCAGGGAKLLETTSKRSNASKKLFISNTMQPRSARGDSKA